MSRTSSGLEEKELFFATLAHDLKNPVQAQFLTLKMFASGAFGKLNSKQKDMLNMILESSNYMYIMLQAILNSYKFDNGIIYLDKKEFCIKELVENCINEVKTFAKSKNINIILNIDTKTKTLFADAIQLRRVISNLLNNSINYSFKNDEIIISISKNDTNLIFSIQNNSPEIPSDIKEHIFEKYVSGRETGIGLGLYFSKKVIDAHSGKIYLNSNGNSNRFIFEIPLNNLEKASIDW